MVDYSNPFLTSFLGSRNQFTQPQNQFNQQQNQYDFSGWGDRLGKIEEGIAGLTKQFNSFQAPGEVEPEYQGNAAPEPLEQSANAPEPLGGIESLVAEPAPATPTPIVPPPATPAEGLGGQGGLGLQPGIQDNMNVDPTGLKPRKPRHFDWGLPMDWDRIHVPTITQELQQQYRDETGSGWSAGEEWEDKAKEMGFDFRKGQYLKDGEWTTAPMDWKGGKGTSRMNQLFEEAGGVMGPRTKTVAGMKWGQGFTDWLGDKGYEVYTDPLPDYYGQQTGLGSLMGRGQQTFAEPHRTQYAMTAEEIKDPTGTKRARMDENARKRGESLNQTLIGRGIDPEEYWGSRFQVSDYQLDPVRDAEQIASQQGKPYSPIQQSSPGGIGLTIADDTALWGTGNDLNYQKQLQLQGMGRPNDLQTPIGGNFATDKGALMAAAWDSPAAGMSQGVPYRPAFNRALQGPTQQKIQQGIGALV